MSSPDMFFDINTMLDTTQNIFSECDLGIRTPDEDYYEIKLGTKTMEASSGDDEDPNQWWKKKRYYRHTQHQKQELEA